MVRILDRSGAFYLDDVEIVDVLRHHIEQSKLSQAGWAHAHGIGKCHLSQIINDYTPCTARIAAYIGWRLHLSTKGTDRRYYYVLPSERAVVLQPIIDSPKAPGYRGKRNANNPSRQVPTVQPQMEGLKLVIQDKIGVLIRADGETDTVVT